MFTVRTKIILAYTIVFGIMLTVFAVIIYKSIQAAAISKLNANLKSYAFSLHTEIEEQLDEKPTLNLKEIASIKADGLSGVHFQLFNAAHKKIVVDSVLQNVAFRNSQKLLSNDSFFENLKINNENYRVLWSLLQTEDNTPYLLETAASMKDVHSELQYLLYLFFILIPSGLLLTGITAFFISKQAFKPIIEMANTARTISGSNLDKRLDLPKANDEVKFLGETLNEMISGIDDAFKAHKQFIANASHEIKTPLTIIQSELELLEQKLKDEKDSENLKTALSEIENLSKLTGSLLVLAKLDSSQMPLQREPIRMDELLIECAQYLKLKALRKNIKFNFLFSDPVEILGDNEKLKSVMINLLDNAIKYSRENSVVNIKMGKLNKKYIEIRIKDDGIGIKKEDKNKIFERFFRSSDVRAEKSGSGLGLSIAYEIVRKHSGKIEIESEFGKGSIFKVILPLNGR
ncbi:MAG TPA: HAMP domain-containing histidine kinase [Ignavibacteria bacterium]|nr:HAMP domain-containing histidine kinase [Ignavibacteria bacterium]